MSDAEMNQFQARAIEAFLGDLGISCEAYELDPEDVGDDRPDRWVVEVYGQRPLCHIQRWPASLIEKLAAAHEAIGTRPGPSPYLGLLA